jgi:hypothetical protein
MERPIGEQFRLTELHPGLPDTITVLEVVADGNCKDCYLNGFCMKSGNYFKEVTGLCSNSFRSDRTSVIFKKIKSL